MTIVIVSGIFRIFAENWHIGKTAVSFVAPQITTRTRITISRKLPARAMQKRGHW